jgi:hypothetical protein
MATKVNIHITGLAVCYRSGNAWKVDFLCDDNHQLLFSNTESPDPARSLSDKRIIEVEFSNSIHHTMGALKGNDFSKVFNIVADAHTGGVVLTNPTLPRRRVSLIIRHAKLHTKKETDRIYGVKRADIDDTFRPLRKVAQIINIEIKIPQGENFIFKIDGAQENIPIQDDCILTFDNDCRPLTSDDCRSEDDSQLYYELIEDSENDTVKYIFTRIDELFRSHPDGNCDPIVSEPPPGTSS